MVLKTIRSGQKQKLLPTLGQRPDQMIRASGTLGLGRFLNENHMACDPEVIDFSLLPNIRPEYWPPPNGLLPHPRGMVLGVSAGRESGYCWLFALRIASGIFGRDSFVLQV